jgi:hypothetical protein
MYEITKSEASSLKDFIECYLIDSIRTDPEMDSLLYLYNILNVFERIGGFEMYDYEPYNK